MIEFREMDASMLLEAQLREDGPRDDPGSVTLINVFHVPSDRIDAFLEAFDVDARHFKRQPGFLSAQMHRGIAGSGVFLNYAVWESVAAYRATFAVPEFQATAPLYPDGATASPHLMRKLAAGGVCVA